MYGQQEAPAAPKQEVNQIISFFPFKLIEFCFYFPMKGGAQAVQFSAGSLFERECGGSVGLAEWPYTVKQYFHFKFKFI